MTKRDSPFSSFLVHEEVDEGALPVGVGRVTERRVKEGGLADHGFLVREGLEALAPVVAAHAGGAHAAEAHVTRGEVHDAVVDAAAAEGDLGGHAALGRAVLAKEVAGQRRRARADEVDDLVERAVADHGQHGPEDLLAHDGVACGHAAHDGGRDFERGLVRLAAEDDLGRVDEAADAVEVLAVDHLAVFGVGKRGIPELALDGAGELGEERLLHALVHEQVVGRHAGLPDVQPLAEGDALGRHAQVGRGVDDARALSAELERDGGQALGRAAHDELAHRDAASEEDVVPGLVQKRGVLRAAALDDCHELGAEGLLANAPQFSGGGGRVGGGLDDDGVARREGAGEGLQGQEEGVVPRCHDERDAIGHALDVRRGDGVGEVDGAQVAAGPAAHVRDLVADLGERKAGLAHVALVRGLAEVGCERVGDGALVRGDDVVEAAQRRLARGDRQRGVRAEVRALALDDGVDLAGFHGLLSS